MDRGEGQEQNVTDRELDLLVDGQLNDASQRELLARLQREPDAWRRCALTFLEAQFWSKEFAALPPAKTQPGAAAQGNNAATQGNTAALPTPARRKRWSDRAPALLMLAGSCLFAVGLTLVGRGWISGSDRRPAPNTLAGVRADVGHPAVVLVPARPGPSETPAPPPPGWRLVTLGGPDGARGGKPIQLPAVDSDQLDEGWLQAASGEAPTDLLRALERTGHTVRQSRRLVPMPLEDGRRMVVPVEQFDVHYVGNKAYQ